MHYIEQRTSENIFTSWYMKIFANNDFLMILKHKSFFNMCIKKPKLTISVLKKQQYIQGLSTISITYCLICWLHYVILCWRVKKRSVTTYFYCRWTRFLPTITYLKIPWHSPTDANISLPPPARLKAMSYTSLSCAISWVFTCPATEFTLPTIWKICITIIYNARSFVSTFQITKMIWKNIKFKQNMNGIFRKITVYNRSSKCKFRI